MRRVVFIRPADIFITPAFERVLEGADILSDTDIKVIVLHWSDNNNPDSRILFHSYNGRRTVLGYLGWYIFVLTLLMKYKPYLIHNMSFQNWVVVMPFALIFRTKRVFYDCRDYYAWSANRSFLLKSLILFFDRLCAKHCDVIIFPDYTGFKYFKAKANDKYFVIPNTVEDVFKNLPIVREKDNTKGRIKMAFMGYTSNDRNIQAIMEAIVRYENLELYIASNYISKDVEKNTVENERIHFLGRLSRQAVIDLLLKCDYCLITYNPDVPNYQNIQPTKFYDSLMSNTPYICSKGMRSLERYVGEEWPNLSVKYGDYRVFDNIPKPKRSVSNRRLYENQYQYEKIIMELGALYKRVLDLPV